MTRLEIQAELAGMSSDIRASDLTSQLFVQVPVGAHIDGEYIVYDSAPSVSRKVTHPNKLLLKFCELWKAPTDKALSDFAQKHGRLGLYEDGAPILAFFVRIAAIRKEPLPPRGREPIEFWRSYSKQFAALLSISTELQQGRRGKEEDWHTAFLGRYPTLEDAPETFELLVNELVISSNLRPILTWPRERGGTPGIAIGSFGDTTLRDVLLFTLMLMTTKTEALSICASCHTVFTDARQARRGIHRFCDGCRSSGTANTVSQRFSRERKKLGIN